MNQNQIIRECFFLYLNFEEAKERLKFISLKRLSQQKKELIGIISQMESDFRNFESKFPAYCGIPLMHVNNSYEKINYSRFELKELIKIFINRSKYVSSNAIASLDFKNAIDQLIQSHQKALQFLREFDNNSVAYNS